MIQVLVVDDHDIVCKGISQMLRNTSDIRVVAHAYTRREAEELVGKVSCDMVLLDMTLPDGSGLEVIGSLKGRYPALPVLVFSMHSEELYAVRCLKAGASGYVTKESPIEELVTAIRKVAAGRRHVSLPLAEKLAYALSSDRRGDRLKHEFLSPREFRVMISIASGKKLNEIAEEMGLSPKTVTTYRTRILEKMEYGTNADIVRHVHDHRLL